MAESQETKAPTQDVKPPESQALAKSNRIAPIGLSKSGALQPSTLAEAIEVAKYFAHSSLVPKHFQGQPGDVLVAMQMGSELGLSPMSSLQNIAVINGRPSLWGDAVLALVIAHPDCEDVVEQLDEKTLIATCIVKRRGRAPVTRTFSMDDAKTAGLAGKQGPWTNYPKRMLQMRARGFALRDSFPDALRGINVAEEASDLVINQTPEWEPPAEPVPGVHKVGRKAEPAAPALAAKPEEKPAAAPAAKVEEPKPAPKVNADGQVEGGW